MTSFTDYTLLIMEPALLGDLKQYLEARSNETYYNVTSSRTFEMNIINQIIEGVQAVHHLDVSKIFFTSRKIYHARIILRLLTPYEYLYWVIKETHLV